MNDKNNDAPENNATEVPQKPTPPLPPPPGEEPPAPAPAPAERAPLPDYVLVPRRLRLFFLDF